MASGPVGNVAGHLDDVIKIKKLARAARGNLGRLRSFFYLLGMHLSTIQRRI